MIVRQYESADKGAWDDFVIGAKNASFLFFRDFMEYHSDRFVDHSIIAYEKDRIVALLPANLSHGELHSHQGLSYGGWLSNSQMTASRLCEVFNALGQHLVERAIHTVYYKCVPRIYHQRPSDEDLYCLFRLNAELYRRDISTVVDLSQTVELSSSKKHSLKRAEKAPLEFSQSNDLAAFHRLLTDVLKRHDATPIHSVGELETLAKRFPDNLKLYVASTEAVVMAAALVFESGHVLHTQYLASSSEGRKCSALDFLLNELRLRNAHRFRYLSFGISTERSGRYLNQGLINQKEGFGGRGVVHDFYKFSSDSRIQN